MDYLSGGGLATTRISDLAMSPPQNGTMLCAPLVAESVEEMLHQIKAAKASGADVVELRVDYINSFQPRVDLPRLIEGRVLPVIITYRPNWEGGLYEGDEAARVAALSLAIELQADFIDVELQVAEDFIASQSSKRSSSSTRIIVSNHNYHTTPSSEEIGRLVARMQATGADIIKFVTTANNVVDSANVFRVLAHTQLSLKVPTIALVMGQKGLISRLLSPKFGGFLTFGTLSSGKESAPGQPTLTDLVRTYRLREMDCDTRVYGIIGNPVGHSKGPYLHNPAFEAIGYNAVYLPFLVDNLAEFLSVYSAPDFGGFSVTIPFKEDALKCCDEVESSAKAIGAVNTIIRRADGKFVGYNTDCEAAISAIEDGVRESGYHGSQPLSGKLCVVIGAGGAGKALAFGAKHRGARVVIANRNFERAKVLAESVGAEAISLETLSSFQPENGMILANSTSVGMQPNVQDTPIPKAALKGYSVVFDAVYTPLETRLLREAKESGAVVVSGLEMFIRQAIGQFELFTGQPAPKSVMREIVAKMAP
ncbi:hypothetical protein SELMODRAFT_269650 [Selaginella moellendorffii]|uniref:shikimate dehydrogenase (NADP(+)) n=1 Tax=Selaginella moellendorffii TaxID=88036 RepID=D8T411_SELML|nr:bifunctional 3-dehydroquinate dehydratase/shikimate dehydrogenase, chloroplastic isoform X1 [Selaginella moellendorffii]EFJ08617.1 hypothetical protein SELMODRAFT_269650 [Selaginella moellendorffii]|eukprot:XP_002990348.1 bifunctional 3-dehydroquinate dehydratase/shikimate dehydrogenase, chloroplastic isoform X1 [Selaginella moellendorffii]